MGKCIMNLAVFLQCGASNAHFTSLLLFATKNEQKNQLQVNLDCGAVLNSFFHGASTIATGREPTCFGNSDFNQSLDNMTWQRGLQRLRFSCVHI